MSSSFVALKPTFSFDVCCLTHPGTLEIANRIVNWVHVMRKTGKHFELRIITTPEAKYIWRNEGILSELCPYTRFVDDVGPLRYIILNKRLVIEGLCIGPKTMRGANIAIEIRDPSAVQEIRLNFDAWWSADIEPCSLK